MSDTMDMNLEARSFVEYLFDVQNMDFSLKMMPKNSGELAVLGLLCSKEDTPMSSGDIAKTLDIKTSRMAALLNALEKKKQIKRTRAIDDKRITYVTLTDEGRNLCMNAMNEIVRKIQKAYEVLGKDEMEHLKVTLRKLCEISKEDGNLC